jgi:hypothetical protein
MRQRFALAALFLLTCFALPAVAQTCSLSYTALNFGTYTGTLQTSANPRRLPVRSARVTPSDSMPERA